MFSLQWRVFNPFPFDPNWGRCVASHPAIPGQLSPRSDSRCKKIKVAREFCRWFEPRKLSGEPLVDFDSLFLFFLPWILSLIRAGVVAQESGTPSPVTSPTPRPSFGDSLRWWQITSRQRIWRIDAISRSIDFQLQTYVFSKTINICECLLRKKHDGMKSFADLVKRFSFDTADNEPCRGVGKSSEKPYVQNSGRRFIKVLRENWTHLGAKKPVCSSFVKISFRISRFEHR